MKKIWIICLTMMLVLGACFKKGQQEAGKEYPIREELVGEVKTITNPDYPRDGVFQYAFIEEISIGSNDPNEESVLNRPVSLKVDPAGRIYVFDLGDIDIKVFDPDGTHAGTIGGQGQGPGEFSSAVKFDITEAGQFLIFDGMSLRIMILDSTGHEISSFKVEGYGRDIAHGPNNDIYFSRSILPEVNVIGEERIIQQRKHLYRVDMEGNLLHDFGEMPGIKSRLKVTSKTTSTSVTSPDAYTTIWTVSPQGILFTGYNENYRIDAYDAEGNLLFKFGRDFTRQKHPGFKPGSVAPEFYPAFYSRYYCFDEGGNLWLLQYTEEGVEHSVYDVFSAEGIYIKQTIVPHRILQIRNHRAYGIVVTEEEFRVVKRFRMVESESEEGFH